MENKQFTKLSALVDDEFTIESVQGYKYKMWDNANSKMLVSDNYEKGYRKLWQVVTDKGQLDLGDGQMGNLLVGVMHSGKADINGCTFAVKSNGKSGLDIRYYLNAVKTAPPEEELSEEDLPPGISDW